MFRSLVSDYIFSPVNCSLERCFFLVFQQELSSFDFFSVFGVVDDLVDGFEEVVGGQAVKVKLESISVQNGFGCVGLVIAEDWHSHNGHSVVDGFEHAQQTTVGDESADLFVACEKETKLYLVQIGNSFLTSSIFHVHYVLRI